MDGYGHILCKNFTSEQGPPCEVADDILLAYHRLICTYPYELPGRIRIDIESGNVGFIDLDGT